MPHKRNPILSERLSGLARVLRGYLGAGPRGRGPVARARHLPQLGRARDPPRRLPARLLRAAPVHGARRGPGRPRRAHARERPRGVLRPRLQPAGAARPGGVGVGTATTPTGSSSATPGAAWEERRPFRAVLEDDPEAGPRRRRPRRGVQPRSRPAPRAEVSRRPRGGGDVSLSAWFPPARSASSTTPVTTASLMVTSDRISAFDVVMAEPIPDKGRVLTAMTVYWLEELADLAPSHLVTADPAGLPAEAAALGGDAGMADVAGRVHARAPGGDAPPRVHRARLPGRARRGRSTRPPRTLHGTPAARRPAAGRPAPRAAVHAVDQGDRGPRREHLLRRRRRPRGQRRRPQRARDLCLEAYRRGAAAAERHGIVIADTKFELGFIDGALALCDEVLTPDSSRFWPADEWKPGTNPPVVRQATPARLARGAAGGTRRRRPPSCPTTSWRRRASATSPPTSG